MWFGFFLGEIISGLMFSNAETVLDDRQINCTNCNIQFACNPFGASTPVYGCPADSEIALTRNKVFVAAHIYAGKGNDVPSLSCNQGCQYYLAETKFTADVGEANVYMPNLYLLGTVFVNPGCTMFAFPDYKWGGTPKQFPAGFNYNVKPVAPFGGGVYGVLGAKSMLFTCQQVMPSCYPRSTWQTVTTLDNSESTVEKHFSYKKTIGTKFSQAVNTSFGGSLRIKADIEAGFFDLFGASESISETINFDWKKLDTEEKSAATTYNVDVTLPAGLKVFIEEVVGICGGSTIQTQMFKVVGSNTKDTLHIYSGKVSNFTVNPGKVFTIGSTLANGVGSGVEPDIGYCCPKKTIWGNLDPEMNGVYLIVGRRPSDVIPNECNSPCIYVKQNSLKNLEYCFRDSWISQSKCETMDNGSGSNKIKI